MSVMKKHVLVLCFTLVVICAIVLAGYGISSNIKTIQSEKVNNITVKDEVECTGVVERCHFQEVTAGVNGSLTNLLVEPGDVVTEGQPLFTVLSNTTSVSRSLYASGSSKNKQEYQIVVQESAVVTSIEDPTQTLVTEDTTILTLAPENTYQVRLTVEESKISEIKVGQSATITGVGFQGKEYSGKVTSVSNEAVQQTSATGISETVVQVLVSVENPDIALKPGFTATATIVTSIHENTKIIPYDAVQAEEDGAEYVFCLVGNKAVKTPVSTGNVYLDGLEITEGLEDSDRIIINPAGLTDGELVVPEEG